LRVFAVFLSDFQLKEEEEEEEDKGGECAEKDTTHVFEFH